MKQRQIGTGGPQVAAIGLGCMGMSFAYGPRDDDESGRTLNRALDLGVNLLDTADVYGAGHNEQLIGATLGHRRDEFLLATKYGLRSRGGGQTVSGAPGSYIDSSPEWAKQACEDSLGRLGFDHIDLYYLHRRNPEVPIEDTVGAMAELVAAGKVAQIGLSEVSPETLRRAHAVHPIAAVQMEYSLFSREVEEQMLDTCRELGVALVAYSPMGRGFLTGTIGSADDLAEVDFRRGHPRFTGDALAHNLQLADAVRAVATELGVTPAQAALAWLLAQDERVIPIPGTKRVTYLQENVAAADVVLSPEQVALLSATVPAGAVAGGRYSEASMRTVGH